MGKEKKKKRRCSSSSSSSSSSDDERKLRKLKKKLKKEQRRAEKLLKKKIKAEKKKLSSVSTSRSSKTSEISSETQVAADIPVALMERSKVMAPMTKEEWDKRQSIVRKVYDEDSGRYRLVKGDGEIIESIVSREVHKKINQQATQADGIFFQANTGEKQH